MRITFVIFTLVYILNVINVFTIDAGIMTFAYIVGSAFLLCPTVITNILKVQGGAGLSILIQFRRYFLSHF